LRKSKTGAGMKLWCLVIALTFLAAFASDSLGQSKRVPTKGQQDQTQSQEQKAAPDQRGTEQLPLVIQPLPTKKTTDMAEHERRDAEEKYNSDWWSWLISVLTIAALFGQLVVFIAQAYFLRGTLRATAYAANAAKAAAEHIPHVERSYLFIVVNEETIRKPLLDAYTLANSTNQDSIIITPLDVEFSFENQGRTPAVIREISASLYHGGELPPVPTAYIAALELLPTNRYVAPNGATEPKEVTVQTPISYQAATSIARGDSFIWFIGRVLYDDIFGSTHEHAFVWRFSKGYFLPFYGNEKYVRNT
jgi:hypothetical protein